VNRLEVKNIRVRSKHGCMPQEQHSLGDFKVDVTLWGNFEGAVQQDELKAAVDYVDVTDLVLEEMGIRSKLIERVAGRIAQRCLDTFSICERVVVAITKHNPPVKHLGEVMISIERSR